MVKLSKIISGGQCGADIAGLVVAKEFGLETGGWMPFGFRAMDSNGVTVHHPEYHKLYGIKSHNSSSYVPRTKANVKESDGTIRLAFDFSSRGEICTKKAIDLYHKPFIDIDLNLESSDLSMLVEKAAIWLIENNIETLNVAGNSEKSAPGTFVKSKLFLTCLLKKIEI